MSTKKQEEKKYVYVDYEDMYISEKMTLTDLKATLEEIDDETGTDIESAIQVLDTSTGTKYDVVVRTRITLEKLSIEKEEK